MTLTTIQIKITNRLVGFASHRVRIWYRRCAIVRAPWVMYTRGAFVGGCGVWAILILAKFATEGTIRTRQWFRKGNLNKNKQNDGEEKFKFLFHLSIVDICHLFVQKLQEIIHDILPATFFRLRKALHTLLPYRGNRIRLEPQGKRNILGGKSSCSKSFSFRFFLLLFKLSVISELLSFDDVSSDAFNSNNSISSVLIVAPILAAYCWSIESTADSTRDFLASLYEWWNFDWITVQESDESIDGAYRSRTASVDTASSVASIPPPQWAQRKTGWEEEEAKANGNMLLWCSKSHPRD